MTTLHRTLSSGSPLAPSFFLCDGVENAVPNAISVLDKEIFNAELEADWRTHFAALPDEQLHALKPEVICAGLPDRVERLTRAYHDEIAKRRSK
jgi:hypothetical protein